MVASPQRLDLISTIREDGPNGRMKLPETIGRARFICPEAESLTFADDGPAGCRGLAGGWF